MVKKINISNEYDVFIGSGILKSLGINEKINGKKVMVVSDDKVWGMYEIFLKTLLKTKFFEFIIENGEKSKHLNTVNKLYHELVNYEFHRDDYIIAFGGGVISDISGFVAQTYMRGINLINIPTTLMAQVDAAVGSKNGVNLEEGKNLIGGFYSPQMVICDIDFIKTQDERQFSSGMAEVIKYCMIKDSELKKLLMTENIFNNLEEIVLKSLQIKKYFVERDLFDRGERKILNFGHTFGHAIENLVGYGKLLHGEAIGLGMLMVTKLAIEKNLSNNEVYNEIYELLRKFNLPISIDLEYDKLINKIFLDKKQEDNHINMVILLKDREPIIYKYDYFY